MVKHTEWLIGIKTLNRFQLGTGISCPAWGTSWKGEFQWVLFEKEGAKSNPPLFPPYEGGGNIEPGLIQPR